MERRKAERLAAKKKAKEDKERKKAEKLAEKKRLKEEKERKKAEELAAQEKATMTLFYLTATAIASAFIF